MIAEMMSCLRDILECSVWGRGRLVCLNYANPFLKLGKRKLKGSPKWPKKIPNFFDPRGILWTNF